MRKQYLIQVSIIIFIVVLTIIQGSIMHAGSEPQVSLTELSQKPIPQNLPWYIVAVFGDNRPEAIPWVQLPDVFYETVDELVEVNAMANIGLGDHVGQGSKRQFLEFYRVMNESGLENQMYAMGNHDVSFGGSSWKLWQRLLGPLYMDYDEIPGWRIAILDTEVNETVWRNMVETAFNNIGNRSMLIAFHKPVKPYVHHNLQDDYPEMANTLLKAISEKDHVRLVVQAHWHGWAYMKEDGVEWIISGSTGAPLYKTSDCQVGVDCVSTYNYLILVLYPNGNYTFYPVKTGENSGQLSIIISNNSIIIDNTKVNVHDKPTPIPVRLVFNTSVGPLYTPIIVPADSKVQVSIKGSTGDYSLTINASKYYAYIYNSGGKAVLLEPVNETIKLPSNITWIKPVKPRHVMTYNEYQAYLKSIQTSTSQPPTTQASREESSSPGLTSTIASKAKDKLTIVAGIIIVLVIIVGLAYSRIKR